MDGGGNDVDLGERVVVSSNRKKCSFVSASLKKLTNTQQV